MGDQISTLKDRLAKGEISLEEFEKLKAAIADNPTTPEKKRSTSRTILLAGLGALLALGVIGNLTRSPSGGTSNPSEVAQGNGQLTVGNASASGNVVDVSLVNNSGASGTARLSILGPDQETRYCRVLIPIAPNQTKNVRFECGSSDIVGKFFAMTTWAQENELNDYPVIQ